MMKVLTEIGCVNASDVSFQWDRIAGSSWTTRLKR